MRKCLFYSLYLKGDGMKPGNISPRPDELSRVDGKSFSNPVHVGAGKFWRLMDMAMEG